MLTGTELSASIDKLLALRKEIMSAFVDTFIMLGISTTVAILIGGLFAYSCFCLVTDNFCKTRHSMAYLAPLPTLCTPSLL